MGHEFERGNEIQVDATPEQVWDAIATGPGIDSWFMGRNDVVAGTSVRTAFGGYQPQHPITAWEPGERLTFGGERAPDGRFIAYDFLIEGRATGSTTVRVVTSGFLPGDDWEDEFEAMTFGGDLFLATLATYLTWFTGRTATPVTAFGPPIEDWSRAWPALRSALGLGEAAVGDPVRVDIDGFGPIDGTVYFTNAQTLGVRTPDALYRFVQGLPGCMVAMHHDFTATDPVTSERAWQDWLHHLFTPTGRDPR